VSTENIKANQLHNFMASVRQSAADKSEKLENVGSQRAWAVGLCAIDEDRLRRELARHNKQGTTAEIKSVENFSLEVVPHGEAAISDTMHLSGLEAVPKSSWDMAGDMRS